MNQNAIFAGLKPEQLITALENLSVKREKQTYTRTLSPEELLADEKGYIRKQMDLQRLEEEAKESNDNYKAKIKALEAEQEEALKRIKNQKRDIVGILYSIPNQVEGKMQMYDNTGELIDERPLKAEERQANIMLDGPGGAITGDTEDAEIVEDEPATLDEAIDQMNEGEPNIAGMAEPEEELIPGYEEDGEHQEIPPSKEEIPQNEEDWDEFEKQKQAELAAKAGKTPAKKRAKKDDK